MYNTSWRPASRCLQICIVLFFFFLSLLLLLCFSLKTLTPVHYIAKSVHHHNTVRAQWEVVRSCCPLYYRWKKKHRAMLKEKKKKKKYLPQDTRADVVVSSYVYRDVTFVTWYIVCSMKWDHPLSFSSFLHASIYWSGLSDISSAPSVSLFPAPSATTPPLCRNPSLLSPLLAASGQPV